MQSARRPKAFRHVLSELPTWLQETVSGIYWWRRALYIDWSHPGIPFANKTKDWDTERIESRKSSLNDLSQPTACPFASGQARVCVPAPPLPELCCSLASPSPLIFSSCQSCAIQPSFLVSATSAQSERAMPLNLSGHTPLR